MLKVKPKKAFNKDLGLALRRGKDETLINAVVDLLAEQKPLPPKYRDHKLKNSNLRECHLQPNWLLTYRVVGKILELHRTGTHSDLF